MGNDTSDAIFNNDGVCFNIPSRETKTSELLIKKHASLLERGSQSGWQSLFN